MTHRRAIYICTPDVTPTLVDDGCPEWKSHTPDPQDYLGWFEWAEAKAKTHRQRRCTGCGLFKVWEVM